MVKLWFQRFLVHRSAAGQPVCGICFNHVWSVILSFSYGFQVATTPESSAQSHQSQGRTRPSPMAAEPEPLLKRPKLETQG
jgi:hypothetical protein